MSHRSFPSLGFDPTPGDTSAAQTVATTVSGTASALAEIDALLSGAAAGQWRGQAAIAFRDLLDDDFRPKVAAAARSFDAASRALHGWLGVMRDSQTTAWALEQQHAEAVRASRTAHAALAGIPVTVPTSGSTPPTPEQAQEASERARARSAASRNASSADAEVRRLRDAAERLAGQYEEDGREAARRLQDAIDIAPDEPGFWDRLADGVSSVLDSIGDFAADLRDHVVDVLGRIAPLLQVIGDIAGLLSTVCGLLAFVPGLQFLAIPALVLGGVALAAHYGAAVGETGSFLEALTDKDVILDAVGLVAGLGALKIGAKVASAARAGSTAAAGTTVTRTVPQLIGPAQELPASYFQLARTSYAMGESELVWRTVSYHVTATSMVATGIGAPSTIQTIGNLATWDFGPLTRRPAVVR